MSEDLITRAHASANPTRPMSTPSTDATSLLSRSRVRLALGVIVAAALGIVIAQIGDPEEPQPPSQVEQQMVPPPMPQMTIKDVENKIIEQEAVDYDASLRLSTAESSE